MSAAQATPVAEVVVRAAARGGLDLAALGAFAAAAMAEAGAAGRGLGIKLTSDAVMRRLNRKYRGVDRPTDVLSFPCDDGESLGDLAIALPTARRQAKRAGLSLEREVRELILHGCLHLMGYDHESDEGEMDRLEIELRSRLLDARAGA